MPANRSRTQGWRRCLEQIKERGGALEVAVTRGKDSTDEDHASHLIWRVAIVGLTDDELHIESPVVLGKEIEFKDGLELVGVISIGQNRWMFHTTVLGKVAPADGRPNGTSIIRLHMPDHVERCQRRNHYRIETTSLNLPEVDLWPLLDPQSVILAEHANQLDYENRLRRYRESEQDDENSAQEMADPLNSEIILPDVGPKFTGTLMNIGGGGIGLRVQPEFASNMHRHKVFWIRFSLPLEMMTSICATAKLAHTHLESDQSTYAGMSFDFTYNPTHQRFVIDQILHFIALRQKAQFKHRKSA